MIQDFKKSRDKCVLGQNVNNKKNVNICLFYVTKHNNTINNCLVIIKTKLLSVKMFYIYILFTIYLLIVINQKNHRSEKVQTDKLLIKKICWCLFQNK